MEFDQAHYPWSIKLQAKQINPRCNKLSDEEILGVKSDAIDNIEYLSLHSAIGFRDPATLDRFELWGACEDLNLPSLPTRDPP